MEKLSKLYREGASLRSLQAEVVRLGLPEPHRMTLRRKLEDLGIAILGRTDSRNRVRKLQAIDREWAAEKGYCEWPNCTLVRGGFSGEDEELCYYHAKRAQGLLKA